jgi:adenosylcobinamide-phosphate synthase
MSLFAIIVAWSSNRSMRCRSSGGAPSDGAPGGFLEDKFNDGGRSHGALAWGWALRCRPRCCRCARPAAAFPAARRLPAGRRHALPDGGLSPVQPFLHRHPPGAAPGRARRGAPPARRMARRSGDRLSSGDIARLAIEQALLDSHRHVFAPAAVVCPAGAGRRAVLSPGAWPRSTLGRRSEAEFGEFGQFARQAFHFIDWVPIRVTAASFAVVGDFEGAVHCWRTQAVRWPEAGSGILLASGAGALGVRLGNAGARCDSRNGRVAIAPSWGWAKMPTPISCRAR